MKKRFSTLILLFSLSGIAWADVVLNLAVTGVLIAGAALGAGLIVAGAGAAWGLGIGLGFEIGGIGLLCAAGLTSVCETVPPNMADSAKAPLSAALVPGGSNPPVPSAARTVTDVCKAQVIAALGYLGPGQCDYSQTPGIVPGAVYCKDWSVHLDGVCGAPTEQFAAIPAPGGGRDTTGKFIPQGNNLSGTVPGVWNQTLPSSDWKFTPADSAAPTAEISPDGQQMKVRKPGISGNPADVVCKNYSDGSMNCSSVADVPVTSPQGTPATVKVVSTQSYSSSGVPVGSPTVQYSPVDNNNQPFDPSQYALAPVSGGTGDTITGQGTAANPGSGTGGGTGTGGGGGTGGTGSCTSGDCSTETTQLANKGLLQGIKDLLSGTGTASSDPQAKTGSDIANSLHGVYDGPLAGLKGWQLPAHSSQCPSGSFTIPNSDHVFNFDGHCQFAAQNLPLLSSIFLVLWNLAALWIVIRL